MLASTQPRECTWASESHCVSAGYGDLWVARAHASILGCLRQDRDVLYRKLGGGRPTCHFFNSFFINKLYKDQRKYCYSEHPLRQHPSLPLARQWVYGQEAGKLSKQCAVIGERQQKGYVQGMHTLA